MNSIFRLHLAWSLIAASALACGCNAGGESNSKTSSAGGSGSTLSTSGTSAGGAGGDLNLTGSGGASGTTTSGGIDCNGLLTVTIRDFTTATNHDFEPSAEADLGADGKPVYAGNPTTPTTTGKAFFDQWYNDVAGVNQNIPIKIQLTKGANGIYTYDNQAFFPIDGQGLGDEGNNHNFHFTDEVHSEFTYKGGETFTFTGDDDLFLYINKKLVINLGGVHSAETKVIDLDAVAMTLGLTKGQTYPLDLFGAERHVTESHYRIDTTIDCFVDLTPPK